jgi:ferredoxin/flavodoxin---NADP+ reductase
MDKDLQVVSSLQKKTVAVTEVRELTESTYVLRLERGHMEFNPGQYIVLGFPGSREKREYSVYSPATVPYLEVLVKEVDQGSVSKKLRKCKPGELIEVEGPFGYFVIPEHKLSHHYTYLFIATGTGISPFHSLVLSYPGLNYTLLHGVRYAHDGYEKHTYASHRYIQCTSGEPTGSFYGRVTDYLREHPIDPLTYCYLCGNSSMVDDAYKILESQGLPPAQLHAEIYF